MAHIGLDEGKYRARQIAEPSRRLRVEFDRWMAEREVMQQMLTGASTETASFALVVEKYGVEGDDQPAKLTKAKLLFDELSAVSGGSAALKQLLNILG